MVMSGVLMVAMNRSREELSHGVFIIVQFLVNRKLWTREAHVGRVHVGQKGVTTCAPQGITRLHVHKNEQTRYVGISTRRDLPVESSSSVKGMRTRPKRGKSRSREAHFQPNKETTRVNHR